MLPLKSDTHSRRIYPITLAFVVACCAAFGVQDRLLAFTPGLVPLDLTHSLLHPGPGSLNALASLALSFFMHANLFHLVANMWYLWIFGAAVEDRVGPTRLVLVYILCGAASMLAQAGHAPLSRVPIVGASGAIAGLMGIHFVLLPMARILVWLPPLFFLRVPSFLFLALWFFIQYSGARGHGEQSSGVAWWAHLGGFAVGTAWAAKFRYARTKK